MSGSVLAELAGALASGRVRVVDLTNTLSPDFPVIVLPPEFGQCAPFRVEKVSEYFRRQGVETMPGSFVADLWARYMHGQLNV